MFWKTPASWLNDSSTRNELSRISHLRDGSRSWARHGIAHSSAARIAATRTRMSARIDFYQQLRRRPRADRDLPILAAQQYRVRGVVSRFDFNGLARLEVVALDEAEERRILVGDAGDFQRRRHRAGEQVVEMSRRDLAVGIRDRIAVRIVRRTPQHLV